MAAAIWFRKNDLSQHVVKETALPPLAEGAVRLRIESFSVTANNVTYAVIGDMFRYWDFFPAEGDWGIVPMWGHAIVEESNCAEIGVGERVYGYLPMATHLDVVPSRISAGQFSDGAAHRQPMSPVYNQYSRLDADPEHDPAREAQRMIFAPLFKTGFLIEAMFRREDWFGADTLIVTSASSKTAMALASVARQSSPTIRRIGLTSPGNLAFVAASGLYDEQFAYDDIGALMLTDSVVVDFAGNASVLRAVHTHLASVLQYSCLVGATHVDGRGGSREPLPGPAPILFFAPDHATALIKDIGVQAFGDAVATSWRQFLDATSDSVAIDVRDGLAAAAAAFTEIHTGKADPAVGIVIHP
jgi:Protein of unknown function (DUF2855)